MATDGNIDFRTYTRDELDTAIARIDREQYPINAQNLISENERRRVADQQAVEQAASEIDQSQRSGAAAYKVRFSKFGSSSQARNSFNFARRGEIQLSKGSLVVRAFRREMLFMGSRIELVFARTDITDVFREADFVSLTIAPQHQPAQTLQFWAQDEEDAKKIVQALPETMSAAGAAVRQYASDLAALNRGDLVTKSLVATNVLVFGAAGIAGAGFLIPNVEVLQSWGTNIGPLTTGGQWWRLVSSMFLHFGVFHLAFNMWALYVGGRLAERLFGSWAFALLYFASGLGGGLASLLWYPAVNSAGASGAIFGVYGAMLAFFVRKHAAIPAAVVAQQRWSGILFISYNLMNGFSHAGIDNADHVGGLCVGFVMGLVLARPLGFEARTQTSPVTLYSRGGVAAIAMIGLLFVALRFSPAGNMADQRFRRDMLLMAQSEKVAQTAANEAFGQFRNHQITGQQFAARLDNEVLPRWTLIQETFQRDRPADDSKLKSLWEYLSDYSESRLAAFRLYESGGRTGKAADFKAAQAKIDQGDIDVKLIKDLKQGGR